MIPRTNESTSDSKNLAGGAQLRDAISTFWVKLIRELDHEGVQRAAHDSKATKTKTATIYLPHDVDGEQLSYYSRGADLEVTVLPDLADYTPQFYFQIAKQPGILGLAFGKDQRPGKYLVPGGRFNEFYGWDSYFIARGLIEDGHISLAAGLASHFAFEIQHYGKILNANRPYYLGRTQPPFLTDLAWRLHSSCETEEFVSWIAAAIEEYKTVWTAEPRLDPETGLSKYVAQGWGFPPEVEAGHYKEVIEKFAQKHGLSSATFVEEYQSRHIEDSELDSFLLHDRSLRESGHDVCSRFVDCCADLVTIDLASLLYKYECDIARAIESYPHFFKGEHAETWALRAERRKCAINEFLWDPAHAAFGDFNTKTRSVNSENTLSATTLWALWAGVASRDQAADIVQHALPRLECDGGLAATSEIPDRGRQWDYPAGWAPHQILAWEGLKRYGYAEEAQRLCRKWLNTIILGANNSGGAVFEKYDVTGPDNPEDVRAEYGNQGSSETGFGWTNASYVIGWNHFK